VKTVLIFTVLLVVKAFSRLFYRHHVRWVKPTPDDAWTDIRLVVLLNHTSLFEWLFAGSVPNRFLWRIASHAVIPAADKTLRRPVVGRFFRMLGQHVVPITRKPDESWRQLLERVDPKGMVIILPEGRMMRADGLDSEGRPMTVRGGVADILEGIPEGRMLYGYSGGLHHIQVPGQTLPKLFRGLDLTIENLEIPEYRAILLGQADGRSFKQAMKDDMERRRDLWATPFSRLTKLNASRT
jgi:1-acyl-sn-glycerol-3-phosphate acyltransferase